MKIFRKRIIEEPPILYFGFHEVLVLDRDELVQRTTPHSALLFVFSAYKYFTSID